MLPSAAPEKILRVSIEAGTTFGWERLTMVQGLRTVRVAEACIESALTGRTVDLPD